METKVTTVWNKNAQDSLLCELKNDIDNDTLVTIWNDYCQENNYSDREIFNNDEDSWSMLIGDSIDEMFRAAFYGGARYSDDYCQLNGYGNLETRDSYGVVDWIDFDDLAKWIEGQCEDWADLDRFFSKYGINDIDTEEILPDDEDEEDED